MKYFKYNKIAFFGIRLNSFQFLCLIHMSQVKIMVGRPFRHTSKKVLCNNIQYLLALPIQTFKFVQIIEQLTFPKQYDLIISILAEKKDNVSSFRQFYEIRQQGQQLFNRKVEIDYHYLCTELLGDNDVLLKSLDQCKFSDLQTIIHKAYDKISEKFHSKFNRRIKKYLAQSVRNAEEKDQIIKIIDLIKSEQTDEEEQEIIKKPSIKQSKSVKQSSKKQKIQKRQQPSDKHESQQSVEANDDQQQPKPKPEVLKKAKFHAKKDNHHHHKKEQEDENDWEDVKDQKFNKRKEKNNKKRHQKYDLKDISHDNTVSDEEQVPIKVPVPAKKSQRKYKENKANDGGKRLFEKSKEKPKKDLRILLGLNGDTYDGWRERMRSERFPSTSAYVKQQRKEQKKEQKKQKWAAKKQVIEVEKEQKCQPTTKVQSSTPVSIPQLPVVVKIEPSSNSLQKIFSYPANGNKFQLNPNKQYRLRVNNNFWVILQKNKLTIEKDKSGFIRDGKFQSNEDYILQAHDLTITFEGLSNLQDGGQRFGNPNIQDFTEGNSQWFTVKELDVYGYGS